MGDKDKKNKKKDKKSPKKEDKNTPKIALPPRMWTVMRTQRNGTQIDRLLYPIPKIKTDSDDKNKQKKEQNVSDDNNKDKTDENDSNNPTDDKPENDDNNDNG